ncbi:histidine triad nucleotide-binding protein [candidate division KSB1 bacterium]|nr:histidine triad nucleotide-binding protein [candidate division KSB1 bacterium]
MSSCIFCKIASGEIPSKKVLETDDIVAFHDVNPQAPKHLLVIPRRHIEKLADLNPTDIPLVGRLVVAAGEAARLAGMEADGYRLVINSGERAGQSVFHLHLHLLSGRDFQWPPG